MLIFGYFSACCSGFRASHFRPNLQWAPLPEAPCNQRWLAGVLSRDESPLKPLRFLERSNVRNERELFHELLDASDDETVLKRCTGAHSAVNYGAIGNSNWRFRSKRAMNTIPPALRNPVPVDVIIPVFNERPEAIEATGDACLNQTYPVSQIYLIDDGSAVPTSIPRRIERKGKTLLIRLPENQRI